MKPHLIASLLLLASLGGAQAQDAAAGEKVFARCRACHQVGEGAKNVIGPQLNGLFGRRAGTVEGYAYSPANKASEIVWTDRSFADYIADPKAAMPGNKMIFPGIKRADEVEQLTAYLKLFGPDGKRS